MAKTIKEIKDEIQKSLINFANEHGIENMDLQVNIKTKEVRNIMGGVIETFLEAETEIKINWHEKGFYQRISRVD